MTGDWSAIRGTFFDFIDDPWRHLGNEQGSARFFRDGLLVVKDGVIEDFGKFVDVVQRHPGVPITHLRERLILPGFIDGHIHFPQLRVLGSYGGQLFNWFETCILTEESKYSDREYSRTASGQFFDALLAAGTTTCLAFTTSSPVPTEEFFDEAARRNMRVISGLTAMDRFVPPQARIAPDDFYRESSRLIERYHRKGRLLYAITPRFAAGCTIELMERCRQLKREHSDCWINTHIVESPSEIRTAPFYFPDCEDYTEVYARHGLLGPKFVAGHGVWLSNDEFHRFSAAGAALTFCPLCNLFLGSGLFRLGRATDPEFPVRLAVGSDIGGGNAFSIVRVLEEAYKIGMCNNTMLDNPVNPRDQDHAEAERNKLSPYRGFYLATLGGARALYLDDLLGNFERGKEADFVSLDWNAGQAAMRWRQSLVVRDGSPETIEQAAQLLFGIMVLGDDRNIDETWIAGRSAYKKGGMS